MTRDHIPVANDLDVYRDDSGNVAIVGSSSSVEFDDELAILVAKCIEVVSEESSRMALTPEEQARLEELNENRQAA